MLNELWLLSLVIFLPTAGVLALLFFDRKAEEAMRYFALLVTAMTFGLTLLMLPPTFKVSEPGIQMAVNIPWIPTWNVNYQLGVDGISLPLVILTSLISLLAMMASWSVTKEIRGYLIMFLILETGMLGVFLALDFFLFYVFWEVMLLPMYFLIGIWGGPRREYAAIKFFLYTLLGGVLMLIAILMFYFNSAPDLGKLRNQMATLQAKETAKTITETEAQTLKVLSALPNAKNKDLAYGRGSFDIIQLSEIGQGKAYPVLTFDRTMQIVAFILLFIGFAIKVPVFPFHTWLPDAHVEAPTPISMILAGVLLKMGGYGILRIAFPICPLGAQYCAFALVLLGVFSIIYGAFAALAQTDFKRMVAYSSVSHMGYVLLGLAVWKLGENGTVGKDYWLTGVNAAMFQMIAHGISSAGMFFMVGVIYDRVHHRDLNKFGGLMGLMPLYSGLAVGLFFAGLGLPGLCGFIGEIFSVLSAWNYDKLLAVIAASGVILTAGYILWAIQRVYLGPEYKGPHPEAITPINQREAAIGFVLLFFAILLGVYPALLFNLMQASTTQFVNNLDAVFTTAPEALKAAGG